MTFDGNITDKKLQCDIDREAAKLSVISSGKSDDIHEYLIDNSMQLRHFFLRFELGLSIMARELQFLIEYLAVHLHYVTWQKSHQS